jgi:hypothetical protein
MLVFVLKSGITCGNLEGVFAVTVVLASILQYLLAVSFIIMPIIAYGYGADAQRAAEAEVAKQGFPAGVLTQHGVNIKERGIDTLLPFAIALGLATLASLNLAGSGVGRILSWILQPIVLVAGGMVTAGQVFATRYVESAFRKSGDPTLYGINVKAFMDAAMAVFPAGFRSLVITRFTLTTAGSLLIIILLTIPPANAYFH